MPRRKSQRSLQRLCLENIAENMQCLWAKDYTDNYLDEYQFRYIQGPFSELAGSLVQKLLRLMGKRLTRAMLHLLLVPHLTELSLSVCPKLVSNGITQMVTVRCKNLTTLDLKGCSRISTDALVDLIEGLPGLTQLDLAETQCNTQVLSAVGSTCLRLRQLNISNCKKLSPASLFHLAYDPTAGTFCCPALQILAVDGVESSHLHCDNLPWALAYLLLALPSLVFLENEFTADAVCLIHKQWFDGGQVPSGFPSLKDLVARHVSGHPGAASSQLTLLLRELLKVNDGNLPAVRAVCPNLARVTVLLATGSPAPIQEFLPWRSLTSLNLQCREEELEALLPVTAHLGAQLESLSLDCFSLENELSFHVLLGHCPNLRKFAAFFCLSGRCGHGGEALKPDLGLTPLAFPRLHDFSLLFPDQQGCLPAPVLRAGLVSLLRHSPCLRTVMLLSPPFSLDGVFEEVLDPPSGGNSSTLLHVTNLSLVKCKVSSGTIHRILSLENPLGYLDLDSCPDIHRKDYEELLRRVSREGLELCIKWQ